MAHFHPIGRGEGIRCVHLTYTRLISDRFWSVSHWFVGFGSSFVLHCRCLFVLLLFRFWGLSVILLFVGVFCGFLNIVLCFLFLCFRERDVAQR